MSNALENLMPYVLNVPDYAKTLVDKHFPGALTLIFEKSNLVPDFITSGKNTVGIRVPNHLGFQKLCLGIANVLDGACVARQHMLKILCKMVQCLRQLL